MPHDQRPRTYADLPVTPRQPNEAKDRWIYRHFVSAIDQRRLKPGDPVPSSRVLSTRWKVSRGVVQQAYDQLRDEGYFSAVAGRGTLVAKSLPDSFLQAEQDIGIDSAQPASDMPASVSSDVAAIGPHSAVAGRAFVARLPDAGLFDVRAWQASIVRASRQLDRDTLGHFDPQGLPRLRAAICTHLALTRGIRCTPADILVVTGIRHAIDLCAQILVPADAAVALEDPGYSGARAIFELRSLRTTPIAVDGDGLIVQHLDQHPDIALVYLTPAHQAPTGVTLTPARRSELMAFAARSQAWILEDDYDSDFSYEAAPLPALKSIDRSDRVIFCGSFNKSMFSGLRVGYVVAPKTLMSKLVSTRAITGRSNAIIDQLALTDFVETGELQRQLKRARIAYKERRDTVMEELYAALGNAVSFHGIHGGFHFTLHLPAHVKEADAVEAAAKAGILVQGLGSFRKVSGAQSTPGLVIGYTALTPMQAKWSARRLGAALLALLR